MRGRFSHVQNGGKLISNGVSNEMLMPFFQQIPVPNPKINSYMCMQLIVKDMAEV